MHAVVIYILGSKIVRITVMKVLGNYITKSKKLEIVAVLWKAILVNLGIFSSSMIPRRQNHSIEYFHKTKIKQYISYRPLMA